MSGGVEIKKEEDIESEVRHLNLKGGVPAQVETATSKILPSRTSTPTTPQLDHSLLKQSQSRTQSPTKTEGLPQTPNGVVETTIGGDITVQLEPSKPPILSRTTSHKIISRAAPLFNDKPDMYDVATANFDVIQDCIYAAKWLGSTEQAMDCDCREAYEEDLNHACGEDSDCINRLTKIECTGQGSCGHNCQNRRFHNKAYADVTVFKTEKKGYGLRVNTPLHNGDFIYEYIGEVIDEPRFRRRMRQYDEEGIKHFYFMSLNKGEFVDATKKGNLGRFCNHSCNPNCYVDKWVVGDKLCMGIFASRMIKAGEELAFNYNVDRYGADPQPCYCGEPNCTGFIGGKTQTERATKLSEATIEALGIEDGDSWDTAVAKKPKRVKKAGEDDEEYVNKLQPKELQEDGVNNLMATLMQCKEKWIAVKLLNRLLQVDEEKVVLRVVRMHGYRTLKIVLNEFMDDSNVCLQVLGILYKFPRLSRNKIESSGIEDTIERLKSSAEDQVVIQATEILELWSHLKMEYRIPRMKRDPNTSAEMVREDRAQRRQRSRSRSRSRSKSPPIAPAGPRSSMPQRAPSFFAAARPAFRRPPPPVSALPQGWFEAKDEQGKTYYYNGNQVQWARPTEAAIPAPPPKPQTQEERLQDIIDKCIQISAIPGGPTASIATTPNEKDGPKEEKWRSFPEEKQRKIYENTVHHHVRSTFDKFKSKLPKEELKHWSKQCVKTLVEKDYRHKRVTNPTKLDKKMSMAVRRFAAEYMNKIVKKHVEKKRRQRDAQKAAEAKKAGDTTRSTTPPLPDPTFDHEIEEVQVSEDEMPNIEEELGLCGKRKWEGDSPSTPASFNEEVKKAKLEENRPPPPPPPQQEHGLINGNGGATPAEYALQQHSLANGDELDATNALKFVMLNGRMSPVQLATLSTNGSAGHLGNH